MMNIKCPTLIIWGRQRPHLHLRDRHQLLEPDAELAALIILRDTGHWVPFERPKEYASHVINFLESDWD